MEYTEADGERLVAEFMAKLAVKPVKGRYPVATATLDETAQRFRGRFQVLDQTSRGPVSGLAVRVGSAGGQYLTGSTDAEGLTQWIERDAGEALAFHLADPGQA